MMGALLGEISPFLRAASINWDAEKITVYFFYDKEISEEDQEAAECAGTEVIASFPEHQLEVEIVRIDYPNPIPVKGELVFLRREKRQNY